MSSTSHPRRGRFCAAIAVALVSVTALALGVTPAFAARQPSLPPNGVYTCGWIADHPDAAAQARVTCDLSTFTAAVSASPVQFAGPGPVSPLSVGCQYVPSSGSVGQGVYAWGTYQYSTYWGWYGFNSPADYTWYVQRSGAVTYTWGNVSDTNVHSVGVPANIYRWGAQNHSSTAQRWDVCWNDY